MANQIIKAREDRLRRRAKSVGMAVSKRPGGQRRDAIYVVTDRRGRVSETALLEDAERHVADGAEDYDRE